MGMYTEFRIECHLKSATPASLLYVLRALVSERVRLPDMKNTIATFLEEWVRCEEARAFLADERYIFLGNPDDKMFDEVCDWRLRLEDDSTWLLSIGTDVKNYDGVIQKFWEWISPWIVEDPGTVIGHCQNEWNDKPSPVIVGQEIETGTSNDSTFTGYW